jgi:hypothetical protein
MGATANGAEHTNGIGLVLGLAKDIIANDNNGVGCNDKLVGLERRFIGSGLLLGDILGYIRCWQRGRIALIDTVNYADFEIQAKPRKEFLAAWRVTS